MSDRAQETPTAAQVRVCAPARPMSRPPRPAMTAASSGSSGTAISTLGFMAGASAFQRVQVFDVDAAPFPEQHHQDGESDRRLGRRHREDEEHEHLSVDVREIARERDEVEVRGEQQQLHAHQQQDDVLAVQENAGNGEREQDPRQRQQLRQRDHGRFSASIFTMRSRSARRTATWALMSCCFSPARRRMVSAMAATIATSSSMTAPTYTSTSTTARNSASSSSQMAAELMKHMTSASAEYTGLRAVITPSAAAMSRAQNT